MPLKTKETNVEEEDKGETPKAGSTNVDQHVVRDDVGNHSPGAWGDPRKGLKKGTGPKEVSDKKYKI